MKLIEHRKAKKKVYHSSRTSIESVAFCNTCGTTDEATISHMKASEPKNLVYFVDSPNVPACASPYIQPTMPQSHDNILPGTCSLWSLQEVGDAFGMSKRGADMLGRAPTH